jgi:hypothetical protein
MAAEIVRLDPSLNPDAFAYRETLDLLQLADSERIALWAIRKAKSGPYDVVALKQRLFELCGPHHCEHAFAGVMGIVTLLEQRGRRRIIIRETAARSLSLDEQSLTQLLAACQNGADMIAESSAEWLVQKRYATRLVQHAQRFAFALAAQGYLLPTLARAA